MEKNSVHTSLVIEVEDQEEPEQQKTYMIDFDDQDIPKDYVVDQVFCGENVTVYTLFEVPEGSRKKQDNLMLEMPTANNTHESYKFPRKNSAKKGANEKRLNGYKPNLPLINSTESVKIQRKDPEKGSLYCLQSLSDKYGVLTPERKPSDFEVLYAKRTPVPKSVKSKFKAVSKGVNTDIVQSPRIIREVEQAVRFNFPNTRKHETVSDKPSCEVIEMEMRQSFSSISSYGDNKKRSNKSTPNFFLIPLLLVDDAVLSHFQTEEKVKKPLEETVQQRQTATTSTGTNTNLPPAFSEPETKPKEESVEETPSQTIISSETVEIPQLQRRGEAVTDKQNKENKKMSQKGKVNVLKEIRKLQLRLNTLIKSIESSDFECEITARELEIIDSETVDIEEPISVEGDASCGNKWQKHDDLPIFSSMMHPNVTNKKKLSKKKTSETPEKEKLAEAPKPLKTSSVGLIFPSDIASDLTRSIPLMAVEEQKSDAKLRKISSVCSINWLEVENRKGIGLSKSEIYGYTAFFEIGTNALKKSCSSYLKDDRTEGFGLKKVKNSSFKLEGSPKSKSNKRIIQKEETHLHSTMGDEAIQKPKNSKDFLGLPEIKTVENLCEFDSKKTLNEEEGDAKLVYSNKNSVSHLLSQAVDNLCDLDSRKTLSEEGDDKLLYLNKNSVSHFLSLKPDQLEVHYCSTATTTLDNLLPTDGSTNPSEILRQQSAMLDSVAGNEKVPFEVEKPTTPVKKTQAKREVKATLKKPSPAPVKAKPKPLVETLTKVEKKEYNLQEPIKQKILLTNRKTGAGRASANSKLHIDKLIKPELRSSRTSNLGKTSTDEKAGSRGGSRPPSRKREPILEPIVDQCKEREDEKSLKRGSEDSIPEEKAGSSKEPVTLYKKPEALVDLSSDTESSPPSFSNPSVVLELCTEKPDATELPSRTTELQIGPENAEDPERTEGVTVEIQKPVVKSVWALTKVLIFEDGTKKVEILEASMNPPENSLTPPPKEINPENL